MKPLHRTTHSACTAYKHVLQVASHLIRSSCVGKELMSAHQGWMTNEEYEMVAPHPTNPDKFVCKSCDKGLSKQSAWNHLINHHRLNVEMVRDWIVIKDIMGAQHC